MDSENINDLNLNTGLGEMIRRRRREVDMSSSQLGNYLGITHQQVCNYEKGLVNFNVNMLYKFCDKLNIEISDSINTVLKKKQR